MSASARGLSICLVMVGIAASLTGDYRTCATVAAPLAPTAAREAPSVATTVTASSGNATVDEVTWPAGLGAPAAIGDANGATLTLSERLAAQIDPKLVAVAAEKDGARLVCQLQKLVGHVTPDGLSIESVSKSEGGETFSLYCSDVGREFDLQATTSGRVTIRDGTVTLVRPGMTEEITTSGEGIRQDFVLQAPPIGSGQVVLHVALTGAVATGSGAGVKLALPGGRNLIYDQLCVTDVTGRVLTASMTVVAESNCAVSKPESDFSVNPPAHPELTTLAIHVDDRDAVYPVRIDPTISDANWRSLGGIRGADGGVVAMVITGTGDLVVGGSFAVIGNVVANCIARWDGSSWSALGTGMYFNPPNNTCVSALACDGAGNLYAGGFFTTAGGVTVNSIAKWNGSSWSALGTGMGGNSVSALAVSGTDLYAGGGFTTAGGVSANHVAKWNGSSWSALGSGVSGSVNALAVSGSDLYVGGNFVPYIAKWNGSGWSAVGTGMNSIVYALAVSGSDLYAGGTFTTAGGGSANRIAKWNGSSWSALGSGISTPVSTLAVSGTDLYTGGNMAGALGTISKWSGGSWSVIGTGLTIGVQTIVVSGPDLYAGGSFTSADGVSASRIARWSGSNWSALGGGMNGDVHALAVSGTDVYAGGSFTTAGGCDAYRIAKWNGSTWSALGSGINSNYGPQYTYSVKALALDSVGNLYAGGDFSEAGGVTVKNVAKWNGSSWSGLGSGMGGSLPYVYALVASGADVYAAGNFTSAGGVGANYIAKWNGSAWSALGTGMNGQVNALAVSGTNLYAGGSFTSAGGVFAQNIAKWDGSNWSALGFGMSSSSYVKALACDGTGNLYIAGYFTAIDSVSANSIAKWNGSTWSALGSGVGGVYALVCDGASNLYAGGHSTTAGGISANYVAKWNGSSWSALGTGMSGSIPNGYDPFVYALVMRGTDLYVGGDFLLAGGKVSTCTAWLDVTAPTTLLATAASEPTITSPIPITITFSESVTGFTATDLTITNGTAGNFSGSGISYAVNITPTVSGVVAVSVVAGVCQDGGGNGNQASAILSRTYVAPPVAPSNPGATNISTSAITWTWQDNSGDESGFNVWADPGSSAPSTLRTTTAAGATSWPYTSLATNTQYSFQVATTNVAGDSAKTATFSRYTLATTPAAPTVGIPAPTTLNVSIKGGDGNPAGTAYAIWCSTTGQWVQAGGSLGETAAWRSSSTWGSVVVTGLTPGVSYAFATKARNGDLTETALGLSTTTATLKLDQSITFNSLPAKTYGDAGFSPGATASSGLTVSYASSNLAVATVSGGTLTIVGAGSSDITAIQAGNTNYSAANNVTLTLNVGQKALAVTADHKSRSFGVANPPFAVTYGAFATGDNASKLGGTLAFTCDAIAASAAGDYPITPSGLTSANYAISFVPGTLTVEKADQSITFNTLAGKTYGDAAFELTATASSSLLVNFSLVAGPATLDGAILTIIGAGTVTVRASQAGNGNWNAATVIDRSFVVAKSTPVITWAKPTGIVYGTALSDTQLNASTTVPGSYTYTPVAGTTLGAGADQTLRVTFTPTVTANYGTATATVAITVIKADQTINFAVLDDRTYGDPAYALTATATSGLTVDYASSDLAVATVSGNWLTLVGAGSANITACQVGNNNYNAAASFVRPVTVAQKPLTVTAAAKSRAYGAANPSFTAIYGTFAVGDNTSKLKGTLSFSCTADVVSPVGDYIITPSGLTSANYAITFIDGLLTVGKADQVINFGTLTNRTYGDADFAAGAMATSALTVSYTSSNPAVATLVSGLVHIVGAGSTMITARQAGDTNWNVAPDAARMLTVAKAATSITLTELTHTYDGTPKVVTVTTNPVGLTVTLTYDGSATPPANAGNYAILVTVADLNNMGSASGTLLITKAEATITLRNLVQTYDGTPRAVAVTTVPADLTAIITYDGLASPPVCAGTYAVNGTINEANYQGTTTGILAVSKAAQAITFGELPTKTFGDVDFTPSATASSALAVTYTLSNPAVANLLSGNVHIVGAGHCTITVSQAGNGNYLAAADVERSFTVGKATPVITWANPADIVHGTALSGTQLNAAASVPGTWVYSPLAGMVLNAGIGQTLSATFTPTDAANYSTAMTNVLITVTQAAQVMTFNAITNRTFGDIPFTVRATGGASGNPVTFELVGDGPATLNDNEITLTGAGLVTVRASQAGNTNYLAAADVEQSFTVGKAAQTLSFSTLPTRKITAGDFNLSATASSGLPVSFESTETTVATVSGNRVHVVGVGVTTITARQEGNANYHAALPVPRALIITDRNMPEITWASPADIVYGALLSGEQLNAAANTEGTFIYDLPVGTMLNAGSEQTLTVHFTPVDQLNYANTSASIRINVARRAAAVTLSNLQYVYDGTEKFATISTTPVSLPMSVTYAGNTALPVSAGSYEVIATVTDPNYVGTTTGTLTISRAMPLITWPTPEDITYGTAITDMQLNASADVPGSLQYSALAGTILNAGINQTLGVTFTPADATNYAIATKTVTIDVLKAILTVKANDKSRMAGQANPDFDATYVGLVNGDRADSIELTVDFACGADATSAVGPYSITPFGATATANYTVTYQPGTLTVGNHAPEITGGDSVAVTVSEDGAPPAFSLTLNANDADGNTLTWSVSKPPGHGIATASGIGASKTIGYSSAPDYNGTDSLEIQVTDGWGGSDTITVNVTILAVNDPPVNATSPTVTGNCLVGQVLTVNPGEWNDLKDANPAPTLTYQWRRANDVNGTGAVNIPGATGAAYLLTSADAHLCVAVVETATDDGTPLPAQTASVCTAWAQVENTPPIATPQSIGTAANTPVGIVLSGSDADNETLNFAVVAGPTHGAISGIAPNLTYTPDPAYFGTDSFTFQVNDGFEDSAMAIVSIEVGSWTMTLQINHSADSALTFGMVPGAGTIPATPGINDAAAWMDVDESPLSCDLRSPQGWSEWRMKATGGTNISWDSEDVPANKVLLLQQIGADGAPVPGTTQDMANTTGFTVAAGATRYYRLICAPPATHDLVWHRGWNLISLPLEPVDPQVAAIFSSVIGKVFLSGMSSWENGQYQPVTELQAQHGYWLYALKDGSVTVTGGAATGHVNLQPGWNLLGPAATVGTSALAYPLTGCMVWDWDRNFYRSVTELHPGSAYWLYAPATGPAYPDFHLGR